MKSSPSPARDVAHADSSRKLLAASIASMFALSLPATAFGVAVTSCLDDGSPGTLRSVVAAAGEGATVDLGGLNGMCTDSTISLATSAIPIDQDSLTLDGTNSGLTIDASAIDHQSGYGDFRVFTHSGTGTLTIDTLYLRGGYVRHASPSYGTQGGCILSGGSVTLHHSTVAHCTVINSGYSNDAAGGGVFTNGNLTLHDSRLDYNAASSVSTTAQGGGAYVGGNLVLDNGRLKGNTVSADSGDAKGGGAHTAGFLTAQNGSTIEYNSAASVSGKAHGGGTYTNGNLTLASSGISGNSAYGPEASLGGGAFVYGNLLMDDGRISANTATSAGMFHPAQGGGAYTAGSLIAQNGSIIEYNAAVSPLGFASGGGVSCYGDLTLTSSSIIGNSTYGTSGSLGGGAYAEGNASTSYSSISYNHAYGQATGGGLRLRGAMNTIVSSTISSNTSDGGAGGLSVSSSGTGNVFELKNSTISSNHAVEATGGMFVRSASANLFNSTIAFNTADYAGDFAAGAVLSAQPSAMTANLQSMLISNNSRGMYQSDLSTYPNPDSVNFTAADNLIPALSVSNLPAKPIQGCPRLGPLRDNGGPTRTHQLLSGSVAIDAGNNDNSQTYDQRGPSYARESNGMADIGAHEVQQDDIVFNVDFEDCPEVSI